VFAWGEPQGSSRGWTTTARRPPPRQVAGGSQNPIGVLTQRWRESGRSKSLRVPNSSRAISPNLKGREAGQQRRWRERDDLLVERRGFELMAIGRCRSSDPNRWRNTAHSRQTLPSPSPFTPKPTGAANLAPKARRFDPSENHPWLASVVDAHRARLGAVGERGQEIDQLRAPRP
jgi:hypothetical protein